MRYLPEDVTSAQLYHARKRRLQEMSLGDLPGVSWDRLLTCRDLRRGHACNQVRICIYCYVRQLLEDVWRPLRSVPAEIFTHEVEDDLTFESLCCALTTSTGGCLWFRRWMPTENGCIADRAVFITPTGSTTLEAREDEFVDALAIPRETFTAPLDAMMLAIRRNLERGRTAGRRGIFRAGQTATVNGAKRRLGPRQPLQPSLIDINPELDTAFRNHDLIACPNVQEEAENVAVSPPTDSAAVREARLNFWRVMYFVLVQAGLVHVSLEEFMALLPALADTAFQARQEVAAQLGWSDDDPRWRQVIEDSQIAAARYQIPFSQYLDWLNRWHREAQIFGIPASKSMLRNAVHESP